MHGLAAASFSDKVDRDRPRNRLGHSMATMASILRSNLASSILLTLLLICRLSISEGPRSAPARQTASIVGASSQEAADELKYWHKNPVVLISIDGFRPEYLERGITPNLLKLASDGIKAPAMRPQFPVLTFPNHFTMVTGVYADVHGIVSNEFYDAKLDLYFDYSQHMPNESIFWNYEPLWNTALDYGHKSAVIFYPGSTCKTIMGRGPTYRVPFNRKWNETAIMHQVLRFMELPAKERPSFVVAYFDIVDKIGHQCGPDGPEINEAIRRADNAIGLLMDSLKAKDAYAKTNMIVLSDHGMQRTEPSKYLYLDDMPLSVDRIRFFYPGPVGFLYTSAESDIELLYKELRANAQIAPYCTIYRKEELPREYCYGQHHRVAPIVVIAEPEYAVTMRNTDHLFNVAGVHGYPLPNEDMKAIFIYHGPSLRPKTSDRKRGPGLEGRVLDEISNLDVYPFVAKLLAMQGLPGNGTGYLSDMLLDGAALSEPPPPAASE